MNIRLAFPPTVNTYYQGRKILSQRGRNYKKWAVMDVTLEHDIERPLTGRLEVNIDVYPPDNRRRDLDNLCKAPLDVLTDCEVWEDDSQIDILRIRRLEVSKPGYVRVHILEIEDGN